MSVAVFDDVDVPLAVSVAAGCAELPEQRGGVPRGAVCPDGQHAHERADTPLGACQHAG